VIITTPTFEVKIDLGLRVGVNKQLTFSGFSDVTGFGRLEPGMSVLAVARDADLAAPAIVVAINTGAALVYLAVAWQELQDRSAYPPLVGLH
jgi:hypothetical protein